MKKKIKALFAYRDIPKLMKDGKIKGKKALTKRLIKLQIAIYKLDEYLETNWEIKKTELNKFWSEIHKAMIDCGIPKDQLSEYSKHIMKYQTHELNLRSGKMPTSGSIEYYYYYKSCDVRLMRQIIYDLSVDLESKYTLPDWRYFDLVTEVNDDVEDMFEDLETINGNYALIARWEHGKKKSIKLIDEFLDIISQKNYERYKKRKSDSDYKEIYKMTTKQIEVTRKLLKKNNSKLKKKQINKAILFKLLS